MTVLAHERIAGPFACTGGEEVFGYEFRLLAAADLAVLRLRLGGEERLTLGVDYVVHGVGNDEGGIINLLTPALAGDSYFLDGDRPRQRISDLKGERQLGAQAMNGELDALQVQVQELSAKVSRAIQRSAFDDAVDEPMVLPAGLRERLVYINSSGQPVGYEGPGAPGGMIRAPRWTNGQSRGGLPDLSTAEPWDRHYFDDLATWYEVVPTSSGKQWLQTGGVVTGGAGASGQAFGLGVGDAIISLAPSPRTGFVRLGEASQALLKDDYPDLSAWAAALSPSYPWGSTSTHFNMPPAAGYALRFASTTNAIDPDGPRAAGSVQGDLTKTHTHSGNTSSAGGASPNVTINGFRFGANGAPNVSGIWSSNGDIVASSTPSTVATSGVPAHTHAFTTSTMDGGGAETRGKNVAYHLDVLARPALVASGLIGSIGYAYKFALATSAADPGHGKLRINHATLLVATQLYISEFDANEASLATSLAQWTASTSSIKGRLRIVKVGRPSVFAEYDITSGSDSGAWQLFQIIHRASNGTFNDLDNVHVLFVPTGDAGTGGGGGGGTITMPTGTLLGNDTAGTGPAAALTAAQVKAVLGYTAADFGLGDAGAIYSSRVTAAAATISVIVMSLGVMGYRAAGDGGHGAYVNVSAPSTPQPHQFKSANNRWFELRELKPRPEQFGAYGDDASHPISADFASLSAAQVMFPFVTDTAAEWDWCALTAAWRYLPKSGGVVELGASTLGSYVVDRSFLIGDGTSTSASTWQNILFAGYGSGVQRNLVVAPSTPPSNRARIKCVAASIIAAVVWILGPMSCSMADVVIDCNNKATRGHYAVHNMNARQHRVTVENYREFGFDLAAFEAADTAAGVYNTHGDVTYSQCKTAAPQLSTSCSVVVGNGTYTSPSLLDVARVAFVHCQFTSGDSALGGGALLRFCDNIDFERCFFYSLNGKHVPLLISPPAGFPQYPTAIRVTNCVTYGEQTWPAQATWTPGPAGLRYNNLHMENRDRVPLPIDIYGRVSGLEQSGVSFGRGAPSAYSRSLGSVTVSTTTTETTIATHAMELFALSTSRVATIKARANVRNASGANADIRIRAKAAFGGGVVTVSGATSVNKDYLNYLYQVQAGSPALTITLPTVNFARNHRVWFENNSSNTTTLAPTGGSNVSLPAGSAIRATFDGTAWSFVGVSIRATLADTGAITLANLASYRSMMVACELFGRHTAASQGACLTLDLATAGNNNATGATTTRYSALVDNLALDTEAPLTLSLTAQWSVSSGFCDTTTMHSTLELV